MTENTPPEENRETPAAPAPVEADEAERAAAPTAPEAAIPSAAESESVPEEAVPAVETAAPTKPPVAPTAAAPTPMPPRRNGGGRRRFAAQGRREDTEESTDPRMRRPAVYEPRSGPSRSRFNPRQPVAEVDIASINYKNVTVLTRFIDQQGRILSRRKSRVDAKTQRRLKTAIKQARHLALLPYTPAHIQSHRRR